MPTKDANIIIAAVLDACIKVHTELGPGLFESVYEGALTYELLKRSFEVQKQKAIPVIYDGIKFVDGSVIIEIKSVDQLAPVHFKQLHTYLRFSGLRNGVLVNFNVNLLKDGF